MVPYLDDSEQDHSFERNAMMLYPFIQNLKISHGRAAEILGVHKFDLRTFDPRRHERLPIGWCNLRWL